MQKTTLKHILWPDAPVITVLALLLGWIGYTVLDVNILSNLAKTDSEADVLNYYYDIRNRRPDDTVASYELDPQIVLFNLDGMKSRRAIADGIRKIASVHPAALVLDILFPDNSETSAEDDRYLAETLAAFPNIYPAIRVSDDTVERSFFAPYPNDKEGLINENSCFCPYQIFNGDTLRSIEYVVAGINGRPNPNRLVNYFDREFETFTIRDSIAAGDIGGKIVIIGDLGDRRDFHDMPFRISGQWRVAGTTLLAFRLSSVLNDRWLIRLPDYVSGLIALVLTFVFACCHCLLGKKIKTESIRNLIQLAVWAKMVIELLLSGYLLFAGCGKIVSPVYAGIALSLTGLAADLLDAVRLAYNRIFKYKQK
jgi:CHASE2 domain-containing sensor protein